MTNDKLKQIVDKYKQDLRHYPPNRWPSEVKIKDDYGVENHLSWMLEQIPEMDQDKAMRWLGFIQGALWTTGMKSIAEMREDNRGESNE